MIFYFAGGEQWADVLLSMGVRNILFSYYYFRSQLRGKAPKARHMLNKLRECRAKGYRFMLDSGAFTYRVKANSGHFGLLPPPRPYFEEYKEFIAEYADSFDVIVELDIDNEVINPVTGKHFTTGEVDAWTDELLQDSAVATKIMPVYHRHRGDLWLKYWNEATHSPYSGIASSISDGQAGIIAESHRWGKFTHGFAQTQINTTLKYTPFDSVDSTTWLRADKYGGSCIYRNGKWIVLDKDHKADRRIYADWYKSWGLNFDKIAADDLKENRLATIIAWRELANAFEAKDARRTMPYLYNHAIVKGLPLPLEHPLITKRKREGKIPVD